MVVAGRPSRLDELLAIAEPLARRAARELILARLLDDRDELAAATAALAETPRRARGARRLVARRRLHDGRAGRGRCADSRPSTTSTSSSLDARVAGCLESGASRPRSRRRSSSRRRATSACSREPATPGRRPDRDAVRRRRARLVRDRARRLARRVARDDAAAPRNRGRPDPRAAATRAGCSPARRCSSSRSSESSPSRSSSAPARTASSKRRATRACSSSASPTAGEPKASARARLAVARGADVPTLFVRRGLRPSGVAPSETLTRFTWTLGSERVPQRDPHQRRHG